MKKNYILIIGVVLLLLFFIFTFANLTNLNDKANYVCIKEKCFEVEISDDYEERVKGLSGRDFLAENSGMLFVFDKEGRHSFWMKDMKFQIDIIWINYNNEIAYIEKNAQPCDIECPSINPRIDSLYVLEINANLSDKFGFDVGDKVKLY